MVEIKPMHAALPHYILYKQVTQKKCKINKSVIIMPASEKNTNYVIFLFKSAKCSVIASYRVTCTMCCFSIMLDVCFNYVAYGAYSYLMCLIYCCYKALVNRRQTLLRSMFEIICRTVFLCGYFLINIFNLKIVCFGIFIRGSFSSPKI